ncbi:hypothetical protein UF75_5383 [Desulfosporosinus sp. I2]|nr:hypothetical protein UF75_5383 [Desulfosporosinus sp. I2]
MDQVGNLMGNTDSSLVLHHEIQQDPAVQSFLEGEDFSPGSEI